MVCALFPGSFNPIHHGHLSIAKYLAEMPVIDEVRLILSPKNPIKDESILSDPICRLRRITETISDVFGKEPKILKKITVSDIEFHLPEPLYTYNTLCAIKNQEPDVRFIFIMGADNIAIIEKWHRWKDFLQENEVWVYPRVGFDGENLCYHYSHLSGSLGVRFLSSAPLYNISSTEIRNQNHKS